MCILLLLVPILAKANDFHLLELNNVYIKYIKFLPGSRDLLIFNDGIPNTELNQELDLHVDCNVLKYGYWNSLVHSFTDESNITHNGGQFRVVGLNMELGVHILPMLDVFAWHYSQHLLDTNGTSMSGFPEQDGIGINVILFSKEKNNVIFNIK